MQSSFLSASPPVGRSGRVGNARIVTRGVAPPSSGNSSLEESYSRGSLDLSSSSNSVAFSAPLSWTSPSSGGSGGVFSNAGSLSPSFQAVGFDTRKRAGMEDVVPAKEISSAASTRGLLSLKLGGAVERAVDEATNGVLDAPLKDQQGEVSNWDLITLQSQYPVFSRPLVVKAYYMASKAHSGQTRKNGDPVIAHCAETALILAGLCADADIIAAALLHDTLDDTECTEEELSTQISRSVCELVKKVSSISYLSQLARNHRVALHQNRTNKLRDMLVGASDCRAVLIKLADRLHNLRTISSLPFIKQARIAEETMEVFVPLAGRLGCWTLKSELEDLCFRIELPQEYKNLKAQYDEFIQERKSSHLKVVLNSLKSALDQKGIEYEDIVGRPKNLYGVYKKIMKRRCSRLADVYDLLAIRVIVSDKESCYKALRTVHELWNAVDDRFKNYIRSPKKNGYQSIHDVVMTDDGVPFEVQIRTSKMHHIAEHGMAAHWRYKESEIDSENDFVQARVVWSRYILSYLLDLNDRKSRPEGCKSNTNSDSNWARTFCTFPERDTTYQQCKHHALHHPRPVTEADFNHDPLLAAFRTVDGLEVCSLPHNSTVGDVLRAHAGNYIPDVGIPLVNGEPARMEHVVRFGDVVEITEDWADEIDVFSFGSVAPIVLNAGPNGGKHLPVHTSTSRDGLLKAFVPQG